MKLRLLWRLFVAYAVDLYGSVIIDPLLIESEHVSCKI